MGELKVLGKHHPLLKELRRLHQGAERRRQGLLLVEGARLIEEAQAAGLRLRHLFYREDRRDDPRCAALLGVYGAQACQLRPDSLAALCETEHNQGIVGVVELPGPPRRPLEQTESLLILEGVSDPGNLGTLLRAARAAGIGGVVLRRGVDAYNGKVVRASAGALFRLPLWEDLPLEQVVAAGFTLLAAVVKGGEDYGVAPLPTRPAWVLGAEAEGLSRQALQHCQRRLSVPMQGGCESLNVAMAGTLLMFEWIRRNRTRQPTLLAESDS